MDKKFDVLVVGELNIDLILNKISAFPQIGKELLSDEMTMTLGSSSAIFASNLKTLGNSVAFVGKLGKDNFGQYITTTLQNKGIDTSNIIFSTQYNTGASVILNFGEDRAIVTYPGAMKGLTLQHIPAQSLRNAKHLHVSSIFLQHGLRKDISALFEKAKSHGLTTSLDPQWDPAEKWDVDLSDLLQNIDIFLPNVAELTAITKTATVTDALKSVSHFKKIIVVKHGSSGAYLSNGKTTIHQPAFLNRHVADSIGAGDSFDAGFLHYFLKDKPEAACLEFAALMGAVNTTEPGGTGAFSNFNTVRKIAKSHFNYTI